MLNLDYQLYVKIRRVGGQGASNHGADFAPSRMDANTDVVIRDMYV